MKRIIFCLGICVLLFTATIFGQPPSPEAAKFFGWAAADCAKRQQTLKDLEAEAPTLRAGIAAKEGWVNKLAGMSSENPSEGSLVAVMRIAIYNVEQDKLALQMAKPGDDRTGLQNQLDYDRILMDFWTEYVSYRKINSNNVGFKSSWQKKTDGELTALKERQTYVANQISLLRDQIPPGGCAQLQNVPKIAGVAGVKTVTVGPGVWVSTGLMLVKGQRFTIVATGTIKAREAPFTEWTAYGSGYYSLKGLIKDPAGTNDQFMQLGSSHGDTARFDGELKLAATHSYYFNNGNPTHPEDQSFQGSFEVTVTVEK